MSGRKVYMNIVGKDKRRDRLIKLETKQVLNEM
jgi:hypothetical protein